MRIQLSIARAVFLTLIAVFMAGTSFADEDLTEKGLPLVAPETLLAPALAKPWHGDLAGMEKRGLIRLLTPPSQTNFFLDGPIPHGVTYERAMEFRHWLDKHLKDRGAKIDVVVVAVPADKLYELLRKGYGDIAAADNAQRPGNPTGLELAEPFVAGVKTLVVTGPKAEPVKTLADLSGMAVAVPNGPGGDEAFAALNAALDKLGQPPASREEVDPVLEPEDVLEMVSTGIYDVTLADAPLVKLWSQALNGLTMHEDLAVRTDGVIAWTLRKDSPHLKRLVDTYAKDTRLGTWLGNQLVHRYLHSGLPLKEMSRHDELRRMQGLTPIFQHFADAYDLDWVMLMAQGYQESHLDQHAKSNVGAVGIMQLMPATAKAPPIEIDDIEKVEGNIEAGAKYMAYLKKQYFADLAHDPANQHFFALAAYNAGPGAIHHQRQVAHRYGLDPDRWFGQVERVVGRHISQQPVVYVRNIYQYYLAYQRLLAEQAAVREAKESLKQ